jgi:lipopolysaccharide heptosyltransferase II
VTNTAARYDSARSARWQHARRVLCVRLDNTGDILMTTPAIRALKQSLPGRHITLLASPSGSAVAQYIPEIDETIPCYAPWTKVAPAASVEDFGALIETLTRRNFDAVVIFTVYSQSALPAAFLCWLARIPQRLAYCRENPYQLLSDSEPELEPHSLVRHEVRRQLDLVASLGCLTIDERLSFQVPEDEAMLALATLSKEGVDIARPWIVVHPGATATSRRYSAVGFGQAISILACDHPDMQILVTGSASEAHMVQAVAAHCTLPTFPIPGKLNLGEFASVIRGAKLLISNNTGPVHLAAAVGTPVVDVYALTNPQHSPWKVRSRVLYHDVPCRFCYRSTCMQQHHACLKLVTPERISAAARELLTQQADSVLIPIKPLQQQ